ncbi:major facilitator superfamily domain-containing protein [Plectosphaerella plurivora]|uniref:Major facilitator superfamily domain-containing protein n=1 Tax=Plectosphaerella plurivora TaxID=936078 RepID=A0A9P9A752_9PEZI|nr:major facilitator superfamily domain-containing protein [Plectosphaerella plurivora]
MDTTMFKSFVEVESSPAPSAPLPPQKAVSRVYPGAPHRAEDSIELQRLPTSVSRPSTPPAGSDRGDDLEMSRPASPTPGGGGGDAHAEPLQSMWDPYMNRWRLLAACLMNFANGLHDSSPGALIPYMEKYYDIGYAVVSLIFVGQAVGFIFAALFMDPLRARLSRAHLQIVGQTFMVSAYLPLIVGAPFPAIVVSFFLLGFGMSINLAMNNIFCGSLQSATTALGFLHGSYGVGGTIGPIVATAVASTTGPDFWYRYYFLTLGLAIFNLFFGWWALAGFERDNAIFSSASGDGASLQPQMSTATVVPSTSSLFLSMFHALRKRMVLLGALFIFAYQGAEVSISGWVISFLIATRDVGNPEAVGYVTAGFWAGITIGRFALSNPAQRIGERRFVYIVTAGAACFQLLVWWVPNIIGGAVSLAIVGLLLGPIYPCAAAVFMRGMSRADRGTGMVVISAFGSSGGAVAPFTTGLLAQASGTWVLHPIALALFACMGVCWFTLPSAPKRRE